MKLIIFCLICCVVWVQGDTSENLCSAPILENGLVEATGRNHPGIDTFTGKLRCNVGFTLVGMSDTIKCRSGIWSVKPTNFPFCTAIGTCPDLPNIENGHKKSLHGFRNSVFKFRCNRGFRLFGPKKMYCTGSQWSSPKLPVCTKNGCDEELVSSLRHGGSRKMLGGGVYRFRCDRGSVMEGPTTVVCDGTTWNETAPICLTAPMPPHLELQVERSPSTSAEVGQMVTLVCKDQGGSPVPALQLIKNGELVGQVETGRNSYTFAMEESDKESVFQCSASNRMVQSPVMSQKVSLKQNFAPTEVILSGEDIVNRGDRVKFECNSESHPNPQMTWTILNQENELVDADIEEVDGGKSIAAFTVKDDAKTYSVQCTASNEIGQVSQTKQIHARYLPESISIDGPWGPAPKLISSDAESVFNCTSFSSYPAASISWNVEFAGDDDGSVHDKINTDNMLLLLEDGTWMTSSSLTIPSLGNSSPSFTIQCEAAVEGVKGMKVSDPPHTVLVTYGGSYVKIDGDEEVDVNSESSYTCKAGKSYPASQLEWTVTDQDGQDVAISVAPVERNSEGEVSSIAIIRVEQKHQQIDIECTASNSVATISNQKSIKVYSAPKSVSIRGPEMVETGETAEYRCMSGLSTPVAHFKWELTGFDGETVDMTDLGMNGDEETNWSRISFMADRSQKIVKITCTASNKVGSVSHIQQVYVQYGPESLDLLTPEWTGSSDETSVQCSSSPSVPAAEIAWTFIMNGQEVEMDWEETEQVPTLMEDGGVSTYSTIKLPAVGTTPTIVKCKALGTWANYQELEQEKIIVARGPPGEPLIVGLRDGAEVRESSEHVLTCSAEAGNPPATVRWFRGHEEADDVELEVHGGNVIATWKFVAREGDVQLRCEAANQVIDKPNLATINIQVNKQTEVQLQEEKENEKEGAKSVQEPQFNQEYETEKESQTVPESSSNDENYDGKKDTDFFKDIEEDKETPSAPESIPKGPAMSSKKSSNPSANARGSFDSSSSSTLSSSITSLIIVLAITKSLL